MLDACALAVVGLVLPACALAVVPTPCISPPAHPLVFSLHACVPCSLTYTATCLPLELCQGVTLYMAPTHQPSTPYPPNAPSLLSSPYLAAHGSRHVVVGATKVYGTSTDAAWDACAMGDLPADHPESMAATSALLHGATQLWEGLKTWHVDHARYAGWYLCTMGFSVEACLINPVAPPALQSSHPTQIYCPIRLGVRALPPRTAAGAMPLAGQVPGMDDVWVVAGLGARGLVYHAWLAQLVAQGVMEGSDACLPKELQRWK